MGSVILYISSFLYSAGIAFIYQQKYRLLQKQSLLQKILWSLLIMLVPIIVSSCRYGIGTDYENYITLFSNFHRSSLTTFSEDNLSLEYINKILSDIGFFLTGNTNGVFFIYAILTLLLFEFSLINFKDYVSLPISTFVLLLLMFSMSLNIVRQALAISIVFSSLPFIAKKKPIPYFISCLVATAVHSSAFISIIFYFLYEHNNRYKLIFYKLVKFAIILLPLLLSIILPLLQGFVLFKHFFENYEQEGTSIIESYAIKLPIIIMLCLNYKVLRNLKLANFLFWLFALELILLFVASKYMWAFRLSYYTFIGQILLVGMVTYRKSKNSFVYKFLSTTYYILYFYILFYVWGRDSIFPYSHL